MKALNEFILCVMNKSSTADELKDAAIKEQNKDCGSEFLKYYIDYQNYILRNGGDCGVGSFFDYGEYWLREYFTVSGENREDYEKELAKNE